MLKKNHSNFLTTIVLPGAAVLLYCSFNGLNGGGGSDVGNGVIRGQIIKDDGMPASRTTVVLVPSSFDPVTASGEALSVDTTNDHGEYEFKAPGQRTYNLLAVYQINCMRTLIKNIPLVGDTVRVPPDTLKWPGTVVVDMSVLGPAAAGHVYIPGTNIAASFCGITAHAMLDSVPSGLIPALYYRLKNNSAGVLRYNVRVPPGDTIIVENTAWKYAMYLFLNTTASGAQVYNTVTDFPVLVRLTAENFKFEEAKPDGGDIRFTKSDNSPLPYEIERWDRKNKKAEVWVKMDTIYGNNSTQYLMMYWGNENAPANSNGAAVFDSARGYIAVWHLNEKCLDATGNKNNGANSGSVTASGMVGLCKRFDGNDYIKIAGLLGKPSTVCISAWVQTDAATLLGQEIISVGNAVLIRLDDPWLQSGTTGAFLVGDSEHTAIRTGRMLKTTGWHFVSYVINAAEKYQTFYIDGVRCASTSCSHPINYSIADRNTFLGRHASNGCLYNYKGMIDEIRVYRNVRSPDWMLLNYMNQKPKDALITMGYKADSESVLKSGGRSTMAGNRSLHGTVPVNAAKK